MLSSNNNYANNNTQSIIPDHDNNTSELSNNRSTILRTLLWHILNIILLALAFGVAVGAWTLIHIRHTAFSLLDSTIALPYYKDTIAYGSLLAITLIVPLVIYFLYGLYDYLHYRNPSNNLLNYSLHHDNIQTTSPYTYSISPFLLSWLWWYGQLQSMAIAILLTQWVKYYSQSLRPDFISICFPNGVYNSYTNPDGSITNITPSNAQANNWIYSTTICPGQYIDNKSFKDAFQSFFSGVCIALLLYVVIYYML